MEYNPGVGAAPGRRRAAVFLDRDGVIIQQVHHLRSAEQVRILPRAPAAIAKLRGKGFRIIVVSNQSAVARGYMTRRALEGIHRLLCAELRRRGARLDAVYCCPHHPSFGRRTRCRCRKPRTGMLQAAARRFKLDLKDCFMVGDSTTDLRTAKNAGCPGILVRTGKGGRDGRYKVRPDAVCRDLMAAARWILRREPTA